MSRVGRDTQNARRAARRMAENRQRQDATDAAHQHDAQRFRTLLRDSHKVQADHNRQQDTETAKRTRARPDLPGANLRGGTPYPRLPPSGSNAPSGSSAPGGGGAPSGGAMPDASGSDGTAQLERRRRFPDNGEDNDDRNDNTDNSATPGEQILQGFHGAPPTANSASASTAAREEALKHIARVSEQLLVQTAATGQKTARLVLRRDLLPDTVLDVTPQRDGSLELRFMSGSPHVLEFLRRHQDDIARHVTGHGGGQVRISVASRWEADTAQRQDTQKETPA